MAKTRHTAEGDRYAAAEDEGRLREYLEQSSRVEIHTAESLAQVLFGMDGPVLPHQRKAAKRWARRLQKLRYPLFPCDAEGRILSDEEADARADRGIARRWRYEPDGRWAREFGETLDAEGRAALADGLVAIEESEPPEVFDEPRSRIIEGLRSILPLDAYRAARRRFEEARAATLKRHQSSLVNQLSRTAITDRPGVGQPQQVRYPAVLRGMMHCLIRRA
jgi:hypothetical protein